MYEPDVWKGEWGYRYKFGNGKHTKSKALGGMKSLGREYIHGWRGKAIHDGALETPAPVGRHVRSTNQSDEEEPVRQEERVMSQGARRETISRRECPTGSDAADRSSMTRT